MDTVALLAWTAASLEDGDKHSLATSVILLLHIFFIMVRVEEAITKGSNPGFNFSTNWESS